MLRVRDRLRHQAKDFVLGRDAAKEGERAAGFERLVQIRTSGRASPEIIAAPCDRLAPQVDEARAARRVLGPLTVAGQEQLPELLRLDRIADMRIERITSEAM